MKDTVVLFIMLNKATFDSVDKIIQRDYVFNTMLTILFLLDLFSQSNIMFPNLHAVRIEIGSTKYK